MKDKLKEWPTGAPDDVPPPWPENSMVVLSPCTLDELVAWTERAPDEDWSRVPTGESKELFEHAARQFEDASIEWRPSAYVLAIIAKLFDVASSEVGTPEGVCDSTISVTFELLKSPKKFWRHLLVDFEQGTFSMVGLRGGRTLTSPAEAERVLTSDLIWGWRSYRQDGSGRYLLEKVRAIARDN